jgi:hypothetical protein
MSNWFDDARNRLGQRQQQEELQRQQALQEHQQLYFELLKILHAVGAREKLDFIRQNIWRCGQIDPPFQYNTLRNAVYKDWVYLNGDYIGDGRIGAGLQLRFEYEELKLVITGGNPPGMPDYYTTKQEPRFKELRGSNVTRTVTILAVQIEDKGVRQLLFSGKSLSTPFDNFAALVQEFDEEIYLYCQTARSPLEDKVRQDQINRYEEGEYRRCDLPPSGTR